MIIEFLLKAIYAVKLGLEALKGDFSRVLLIFISYDYRDPFNQRILASGTGTTAMRLVSKPSGRQEDVTGG